MSDVHYVKHRVFRETEDVIFYDISVENSNASDLVVHTGSAVSPPDDVVGAKQFYIHKHQTDHNRVVSGDTGSIVINQAVRDDDFVAEYEFIPVSAASDSKLYDILLNEKPVIHKLGD